MNGWIRTILEPDAVLPVLLSVVGIEGLVGWLGGELVYIHKVGVAPGEPHRAARRSSKRAA